MLPVMAYAWLHACVHLKRTLHLLANTYYMQFIKMATLCVPSLTVVVCRMLLLVQDYTGAPVWALLSCCLRPPWLTQYNDCMHNSYEVHGGCSLADGMADVACRIACTTS
jgi:hypothetical protein